jgi:hypothetical protein
MKTAILIFAFNRPISLAALLKSLQKQYSELPVYVYIDGPRNSMDIENINSCAEVCSQYSYIKNLKVSTQNKGLKYQILHYTTQTLRVYDYAIILEDDLVLCPGFVDFHLTYLPFVNVRSGIYQVSGHMFSPLSSFNSSPYILPVSTSWGWSTSRDVWYSFIQCTQELDEHGLRIINTLAFNLYGAFGFIHLLKKALSGRISSWAILFYYFLFVNSANVIHPPSSLVANTGYVTSPTNGSRLISMMQKILPSIRSDTLRYTGLIPAKTILISMRYNVAIFIATLRPISFLKNLIT